MLTTVVETTLLADFSPGSESSEFSDFYTVGQKLYFTVNQRDLWETDGTSEGTQQVEFVVPAPGVSVERVLDFDLFARADGIWRTDGSAAGTFELVAHHEWYEAIEADGVAYLFVGAGDEVQLFRTNGSTAGTQRLQKGNWRQVSSPVSASSGVLFAATGADGETWLHRIANASSLPNRAVQLPGEVESAVLLRDKMLLFVEIDDLLYPWISDGTDEGTYQLSEAGHHKFNLMPGTIIGNTYRYSVLFSGVFETDGTRNGTRRINQAAAAWPIGQTDDYAFFRTCHRELSCDNSTSYSMTNGRDGLSYRTTWGSGYVNPDGQLIVNDIWSDVGLNRVAILDGQADSVQVVDRLSVGGPSAWPTSYANVGENWYFASRRTQDSELVPVAGRIDIADAANSVELPVFPGEFLTQSSSTSIGATRFRKLNAEPLMLLGDNHLFALHGGLLPTKVADLPTQTSPRRYHYADDAFYFTNSVHGEGTEVWVTDATVEGTQQIDLYPGPTSSEPELINWFGQTLVVATTPDFGRELWLIETRSIPDEVRIQISDTIMAEPSVQLHANVWGLVEQPDVTWDINGDGEFGDLTGTSPRLTRQLLLELQPTLSPGLHTITARLQNVRSGDSIQGHAGLLIQDVVFDEILGDINLDSQVDDADFLILAANFGATEVGRSMGDINGDAVVDFADFLILSGNYRVG